MDGVELTLDVLDNELQGANWAIETCNIRLEFLASLSELDEQQIFEKEQIEIDLAKQEVKKAWLLQKQAEIS